MRSTAIFALAAASVAFADQTDSFKAIKDLVDSDVKAAASGSFSASTSGTVGTQFLPGKKDSSKESSTPDIAERAATQQVYGQCGGGSYSGPTSCASGSQCYRRDATYSQCLPTVQQIYGQCGGTSYFGTNACQAGSTCKKLRSDYSQCIPNGAKSGAKTVEDADSMDMEPQADMDPKHTAEGEDVDPVHASMSAAMASAYKTEATSMAPPAYTSEAPKMMTEDTMMAMPTSMAKESSMMMESSMMAKPTTYPAPAKTESSMMAAKPTTAMYGSMNATKTAGSPAASGTGMGSPKPYEGAAAGLVVPGVVVGAMGLIFGMMI